MKNIFFALAATLSITSAVSATTISQCVDGKRSMTVVEKNGKLIGRWVGFNDTKNMFCTKPIASGTIRCENEDFYVVIFTSATTNNLTAQLNLKGDFGLNDTGYLHSLYCK
jgi:hypothetical protein